MSLIFKTIQTEGIAELSYLLGDDDEGVGAIFDPRADVEIYVEMAREAGLAVTHIFETHIHADLVSGSRELCARLESAKIYSSGEGGAEYGFAPEKIKDGDRFTFCFLSRASRLVRRETHQTTRRTTIPHIAGFLSEPAGSRDDLSESRRRLPMRSRHWGAVEQHHRLRAEIQ